MVPTIFREAQAEERKVRPPALAGTWYPAKPKELEAFIDILLAQAVPPKVPAKNPPIRAIIVPHAGYRFSGETAMAAMQSLRGTSFKRVIILGPSHQQGFSGFALPDATHFRTPLGDIALDVESMAQLSPLPMFRNPAKAHDREHSVEIQLPLLQKVLTPGWKLLPILVGQLDIEGFAQAAAVLQPLLDEETLLLVSGDFTHYGQNFNYQPFPVDANTKGALEKLDMGAVEKILGQNPKGFWDYRQDTGITACAFGPVMVLLHLLDERVEPRLVQYRTSGESGGDFSHSVSYVAMTFHSPLPLNKNGQITGTLPENGRESAALPEAAMKQLHALAVATVVNAVTHGGVSSEKNATHEEMQKRFKDLSGAFVTLKRRGRLRGCIGHIEPVRPLYQAIVENALNAALRDSRFQPVTPDELDDMELEVSVLSPMRPADSWEAFSVGQHGVVMSKNGRRAVFLPEVAVEQKWNREQTLTELSLKAGLPGDAWRQGAKFELFTTQSYTAPVTLVPRSNTHKSPGS